MMGFGEIGARVQVVSRQKLNSNRENIVLYSINLDVFSIAIEFLTTNDLDSVHEQFGVPINLPMRGCAFPSCTQKKEKHT